LQVLEDRVGHGKLPWVMGKGFQDFLWRAAEPLGIRMVF
jgi:hypothetical protein